jgi:hypothetical protein
MAKSHLKLVAPSTVNRTVTPTRRPNGDLRTREYLTETEVERLMAAARKNLWESPSAQPLADDISETEAESKESKQDDNSS